MNTTSRWGTATGVGLLTLAYFLAAWLGLTLAFAQAQVSPIWPPTGLALAALIRFEPRFWPGIFLGAFMANTLAAEPFLVAAGVAAGNTLEALLGAYVLRRFFDFQPQFERAKDVVVFVVVAAVLSTTISATLGVTSLGLGGVMPWADFAQNWQTWWFGDALGALVMAPMLLTWSRREPFPARRFIVIEAIALALVLTAVSQFAFTRGLGFRFLVFPPLIWAALRFGPRGATLGMFATAIIAVWHTVHDVSPFAGLAIMERLHYVQIFAGVSAVTMLILAAVKREREGAREQLRQHRDQLEAQVATRTAELETNRAELQDFLDNASDLIQSVGLDGRYRFVNRAWCETLGYSSAEVAGLTMFDVISSDQQSHCGTAFQRLLATGEAQRIETEFRRKDGRIVAVEGHVNVRREEGRPATTRGVFRDITARKLAERSLRDSEARYRLLVDNLKEVVFQTDATGRWLFLNSSWAEITGFTVEESLGRVFLDYVHADDRTLNAERFHPLIAREKDYCRHEIRYLTRDGGFRWIEVFARLTLDERGNPTGTAGTLTDVTERRRAAVEITQMAIAVNAASDGIARLNAAGEYTHLNRAHVEMFGFTDESELLGRSWREIYLPEEITRLEGEVFPQLAAHGSWSGTATARRRDGSMFPEELSLTVLPDGGLACICRDVTARVRAEEALRVSEMRWQLAIDGTRDGIWDSDLARGRAYLSPRCRELSGLDETALLRLRRAWPGRVHPEDRARVSEALAAHLAGRSGVFESEYRLRGQDDIYRWVLGRGCATFDSTGRPVRMVGVITEISERKQAEQQLVANLAREKELNELKSHFVSMASHELRTPLATFSLAVDFLSAHHPKLPPAQIDRTLATTREGVRQLRSILDNLLLLGQADDGKIHCRPVPTNVGPLLRKIADETAVVDKQCHPIEASCLPEDLQASLDPQLVRHILGNLLSNACKYSPEGRPVRIATIVREQDIEFTVTDRGIGIPAEDQTRLFTFFFRARNVGGISGSGLGLLVVRRCLEAHGGSVAFTSVLGEGTRFTVTLPLSTPSL
jgi:PAS domain S-box-containing protein